MTAADYNECVKQYADRLYRFALSMLHDSMDAEDVIQAVFERLWMKVEKVQYGSAKSYLFTSVYRASIDNIRKRKHSSIGPKESSLSMPSVELQVETREILELVLDKLSEDQKAMVLLRDYEGYPYSDIADIMGIPISRVKINLYRARKKLQYFLKNLEVIL